LGKIIGIDLGTTNSEVAIIKDGKPFIIPDENGELILPSFVGISTATGELLVGRTAKNQYIAEPENTIKSIKRKMGSDEKVKMGKLEYSPQEISAFILRRLKEIAENYLNEEVEQAVITVPAYFSDAQRKATRDAGEIAGLDVVRIINEPTAAALAYGLDKEEDQFLMVYDLGGGTFDVSIIEINSGVLEVRASHGDTALGGDDFDQRIVDYVSGCFNSEFGVDLKDIRKSIARVTRASEGAKIELSDKPFAKITEEFIAQKDDSPLNLDFELSRSEFEELIGDLIESTIDSIDIALSDAELTYSDIDKVLLVGGSTRIPLVWEVIKERLGIDPRSEIDPDLCVAMGAAVQAGIIEGEDIDKILVDVTSHSLGIEVAAYKFGMLLPDQYSVLIRRNSTIPCSKSEVYSTVFDNQDKVTIKVYQGENEIASENSLLGEFTLEDIPRAPAGRPQIVVRFDYDIDGIVHVSARERDTGKEKKISVSVTSRLTEEDKEQSRERVEQTWSAAPTASAYEETMILIQRAREIAEENAELRGKLNNIISRLLTAMNENDEDAVTELEDELLETMYEVDFS